MLKIFSSKIAIGILTAAVLVVGSYFLFFRKGPAYKFIKVERGSITESVSLTGNTLPTESVSLSFGSSGVISQVYSDLGKEVHAGQVLASLNLNELLASLHQAEANVEAQKAKLRGLQNGAQPIDASTTFIAAMRNAYLKIESATLNYGDSLFTDATSVNPIITIRTQNPNEETAIENERLVVGEKLKKWKEALADLNSSSDAKTIKNARVIGREAIIAVSNFLDHLGTIASNATVNNSGVTQTEIDANRSTVNTAAQSVSTGATSEQAAYDVWNSAPQDIDAQVAAVKAVEASVESAQAKIQNAQIIAPISGIVTQFDAKTGQLASPGTPLVSIMSDGGYEVEAGASEIDVGKILVGNLVTMTLDAFQNETFAGSVFYIAPAETNNAGVVSYKVKIAFDKPDPRLKSGLTANIDIQTKTKNNVLILPQYAILQNDEGTFVQTLVGKETRQNPVVLGIADQKGNVEVISGVEEGEQVLNIGLKIK